MDPTATTADWIVAFGTVVAAVGTVGALLYAARAAKAASESADAASVAVQNETLPLLLDVPYEYYTDGKHEYPWPLDPETGMQKTPIRGQIGFDPATVRSRCQCAMSDALLPRRSSGRRRCHPVVALLRFARSRSLRTDGQESA